ncbi:MAG: dihydrofolate reductase [Candidatus Saccharibacteria bacterium]|nr:dihydrofolate reductase [Candidatus Saccharibacteria bacterium]
MSFSIIAAVGENLELGLKGGLVFDIPEDMKFFRKTTTGHPVLMGLNTFRSIGKVLPRRRNLVVSKSDALQKLFQEQGGPARTLFNGRARLRREAPETAFASAPEIVSDLERFIRENKDTEEEIFVIGGGMIYRQLLPFSKVLYLTEVQAKREADTFFPEFDKKLYDREVLGAGEKDDLKYEFVKYTLKGSPEGEMS